MMFSLGCSSVPSSAKTGGASIAGPANPLLLVRYQALVESDFDAWRSEYILPGAGGFNEYGKPSGFMKGADGQPITGGLFAPALTEDEKEERRVWESHNTDPSLFKSFS